MAHIEVIPAGPEQEPVLTNLLELYAHVFSEFFDIELGADGKFGYPQLPLYWSEAGRHACLVRADGALAGFVLVKRAAAVWDMAEFFVARRYRRHGIGTAVAHEVWRQFPGRWEVRVMQVNLAAYAFWGRTIAAFTGGAAESVVVEGWHVFSFESI